MGFVHVAAPLLLAALVPTPLTPVRRSIEGRRVSIRAGYDGEGVVGEGVAADELSEDEDGLMLLRAASAAARDGGRLVADGAASSRTIELAACWNESYIDEDSHVQLGSYMAMVEDESRTPLFAEAIRRRLRGSEDQVVLDIGTGAFCCLAMIAAHAGARKVYAVEANPEAAETARESVRVAEAEGLVPAGVVTVIEGFSTDIELPERADLLVAEIVGDLASEEGLVPTMRDAQSRHLKRPDDPMSYIPQRVQSWCAPASYLVPCVVRPPYSPYDFAALREGYPVRVSCEDAAVQLLSEPQLLEDFAFGETALPAAGKSYATTLRFSVDDARVESATEAHASGLGSALVNLDEMDCSVEEAEGLARRLAGSLAGLACWPQLVLDDDLVVESRGAQQAESHWSTVVSLLSPRPLEVSGGDEVHIEYEAAFGERVERPTKYELRGELRRRVE